MPLGVHYGCSTGVPTVVERDVAVPASISQRPLAVMPAATMEMAAAEARGPTATRRPVRPEGSVVSVAKVQMVVSAEAKTGTRAEEGTGLPFLSTAPVTTT